MDQRIKNLACILVKYSINVKKTDTVLIQAKSAAEPLVTALYEEILKNGGYPVLNMSPATTEEIFYRFAAENILNNITEYEKTLAEVISARIFIYSDTNTKNLTNIDPTRLAKFSKSRRKIIEKLRKKPWVITIFPTHAYAQDAEMSLTEFEDIVYSSTFADRENGILQWKILSKWQEKLIAKLSEAREVKIVGKDTDISFSVKGRKFINSDGKRNMPSGEIFCAPIEDSIEGKIRFELSFSFRGREISNITLVFKKGKIVESKAEKGDEYLKAMLSIDNGAKRIGEFGIGTNPGLKKFTKNILLDEKIYGTIHLALGSAPGETKGKNRSAIHWDLIKDLRQGGEIYINRKLFQKDGKFTDRTLHLEI